MLHKHHSGERIGQEKMSWLVVAFKKFLVQLAQRVKKILAEKTTFN